MYSQPIRLESARFMDNMHEMVSERTAGSSAVCCLTVVVFTLTLRIHL